jgi:hypothetical protein
MGVSCFDPFSSVASRYPPYPLASGIPAVSGCGSGLVEAVPSLRRDPVLDADDTEVSPRPSPDSFDEEDPNTIIIMDGCNIVKHKNTGRVEWHLLDAATGHYVNCKFKDILVFFPSRPATSTGGKNFELRWRGKAELVECPHGKNSGVIDDEWMVKYATKKIHEGRRVRVISNDNFKDHNVDPEWRRKNTGKFIFVGNEFVVKYPDIEVGTTSTRSTGVDKFQ